MMNLFGVLQSQQIWDVSRDLEKDCPQSSASETVSRVEFQSFGQILRLVVIVS